jgi:uncharacterized membrane protein (UPF0127 family)
VILRPALIAAALLAVAPGCGAEPQQAAAQPTISARSPAGLELVPLEIASGGQRHRFTVEVARTREEQARGLMFRERLGPAEGMIFPFPQPRPASFWMKNTLIPLDMLFIRADGTIARIAANTVPHSLEPVAVAEPVAAVLEIAGGRAAELGISEGDRVSWVNPGG